MPDVARSHLKQASVDAHADRQHLEGDQNQHGRSHEQIRYQLSLHMIPGPFFSPLGSTLCFHTIHANPSPKIAVCVPRPAEPSVKRFCRPQRLIPTVSAAIYLYWLKSCCSCSVVWSSVSFTSAPLRISANILAVMLSKDFQP